MPLAVPQEKPAVPLADQPGYLRGDFIYEKAPFPSCHASTLAETKSSLVAAWFGGKGEGRSDVGIWFSRHDGQTWSVPREVANGLQPDGKRHPCWNPVLFQPKQGPLQLFYKVGPSPTNWWGMVITSTDAGQTWSPPQRLPGKVLGPIKNKPLELLDGTWLCPSSVEYSGRKWQVVMERTADAGKNWTQTPPLNRTEEFAAIQPTILRYPSGKLQILNRTMQKSIAECWSEDDGLTWTIMEKTSLPNPNSGIDAVMLRDGRALLVYNHTTRGRSPLNVAISHNGDDWYAALVLENQVGEYSYPAVIQTTDGLVHVTYTWNRVRIKHVVIDPAKLQPHFMKNGQWPG
jgi:predicted neuraminidase